MPEAGKELKKILIVEDENIVAKNLKMIVEELGYGVLGIANSGESALDLIEKSNYEPALVMMDITLKGPMDGIEAARRIQDSYDAPILYITGNKDQITIQRAVENTLPLALINKPFNVDVLNIMITQALNPELPSPDTPKAKDKRVSERLPIPSGDNTAIRIKSNEYEASGVLKNLSMTGAGFAARDLILGTDELMVTITTPTGFKDISTMAHVRHMRMTSEEGYYGIELELDRESQKDLAAYYAYLVQQWYSTD